MLNNEPSSGFSRKRNNPDILFFQDKKAVFKIVLSFEVVMKIVTKIWKRFLGNAHNRFRVPKIDFRPNLCNRSLWHPTKLSTIIYYNSDF